MSLPLFEDLLKKSKSFGVSSVRFTGGEPALWEPLIEGLRLCRELSLAAKISTEDPDLVTELAGNPAGASTIESISITLLSHRPSVHDGLVGIEGHFKRIVAAVYTAAIQIPIKINFPITAKNIGDFRETRIFIENLGVESMCLLRLHPTGRAIGNRDLFIPRETMSDLINEIVDRPPSNGMAVKFGNAIPFCVARSKERVAEYIQEPPCKAGFETMTVCPDGTVKICMGISEKIGDLKKQPWSEIINSPFATDWRSKAFIPDKCIECPVVDLCRGGCRAAAVDAFGYITAPDPLAGL